MTRNRASPRNERAELAYLCTASDYYRGYRLYIGTGACRTDSDIRHAGPVMRRSS